MRGQLKAMDAGDVVFLSLDNFTYGSIRNSVSVVGLEMRREYTAALDRPSRTVKVTRVR